MDGKKKWVTKLMTGPAEFYVESVEAAVSKNGNDMFVCKMVIDQCLENGNVREYIREYLLPAWPKRIESLFKASSRDDLQLVNCNERTLAGLKGKCELGYDPEWENYKVKKYVFPKGSKSPPPIPGGEPTRTLNQSYKKEDDFDDDIPFN